VIAEIVASRNAAGARPLREVPGARVHDGVREMPVNASCAVRSA
jgi:xanthine dehydrogenase accessory factor